MIRSLAIAAVLGTMTLSPGAAHADIASCTPELADAGKKQFKKCRACHKVDEGKKGVGPHLAGVVGRGVADVDGFKYSHPMKAFGADDAVVWDFANLDQFLTKPAGFLKGTKMKFKGVKKEDQRKALICYLNTLGG